MKKGSKQIEYIKTFSIVVLLFSTVLLLYFSWENALFNIIKKPLEAIAINSQEKAIEIQEVIIPKEISINYGTEYSIIENGKRETWQSFIAELEKFTKSENMYTKEIAKDQFEEALKYKSIIIKFDYLLDFAKIVEIYGITRQNPFDSLGTFDQIAYSEASKESLLFYDSQNDKYIRLISEKQNSDIIALIETIPINKSESYYPMQDYFGISNNCLIPLSKATNKDDVKYISEISIDGEEKIVEIAQTFFGKNFDFIRKIRENDNTQIYMYGYGEKMLISYNNGSFEYKEEAQTSGASQESFALSLKNALEYINNHGGSKNLNEEGLNLYLSGVTEIDKKKGYKFSFSYTVSDSALFFENESPIVVEMLSNQVISYKRHLLTVEDKAPYSSHRNDIIQVADIISNTYNTIIKNVLGKSGVVIKGTNETQIFEETVGKITQVHAGYFKQLLGDENTLKYAWIIETKGSQMFFDISTGEYLGHKLKTVFKTGV